MPSAPRNFNLQRELDERDDDLDWHFGAMSKAALVSIPLGEREQYLPKGETQFDAFTDFQDCASRSPVNHLEAVFTYHYHHAMMPENKKWLEDNQYILDGKVAFSDRFIAILSGTTHDGNSLKSPIETIRTKGLVPKKLLPKEDWMKWEDYYDSSKITPFIKDLGKELLVRFPIEYEQVALIHFGEVLKEDMIGVAAFAWPVPVDGVYPPTDGRFNHAFLIYELPKWQIFDNYLDSADNDFDKTLSPAYKFYEMGYRVYIAKENVPSDNPVELGLWKRLYEIYVAFRDYLLASPPAPTPIPTAPVPMNNLLNVMCLTIQKHEGYFEGSRSFRNKNPFNLRNVGQVLAIGSDPLGFCIFRTYEDGFNTGKNMILNAAKGLSKVYKPSDSLYQFFAKYAPSSDNNDPKRYAEVVAGEMKVNPATFQIKEFANLTGFSPVDNTSTAPLSANIINGMSYSTIFVAVIVNAIMALANYFGVNIGNDAAMAAATVIVNLLTGAWIAYKRTKLQEAPNGIGDVNAFGARR